MAARQTDKQKIQNSEGPVTEISESVSPKRFKKDSDSFQINNDDSESESSVEGFIFLKTENLSIVFEMSWLSGNKEYFHQIFQYFKNHWNEQT